MDLYEDNKEKIKRTGCDDYQEKKRIRPADHDQELKMNSDYHQHQEEEEEEEEKINRPDQDHRKKEIRPEDDDVEVQDEAAAPSEIQTLRIKIKLSKSEQENKLQQCACTECGKVFSSRKAWGGHWKMHLKDDKEKESLKKIRNNLLIIKSKKLQNSISNSGGGGGGCRIINAGDPVCSICHREFKSRKSLFGHMRSHPDRGWKGIRPPVEQSGAAASPSPSASDVVGYVDLSRDLIGWTQTGKRGRPSTYCAASSLMNLAYSNPAFRIINSTGARIEESASKRKKITISDSKAYLKSRDLKIEGEEKSDVQEFKCSACSRSFTSFQALGGHKSFHSKEKSSENNVVKSSMDDDSEAEEEDNIANDSEENETAHQCDVCDKSFSSGQALGGHKRCHWKGQADQVASSSGEENQVVSNFVANEPGRKILDFDLNELPYMDNKEEEEEER